jgi:hypothetical protein
MTIFECRTVRRRPTHLRKFASVPLKREPLTQRLLSSALNRRRSVAAATVRLLRLGYAAQPPLGCYSDVWA